VKKILFVCHGNICRSPMAEFVMKDMLEKNHLSHLAEIASGATSSEELGCDMHRGTKKKLTQMGIPFTRRRAWQISASDYEKYDWFIGMDRWNLKNMVNLFHGDPEGKVMSLLSFAGSSAEVADPWYTGDFDATYRDVVAGCEGILKRLKEEQKR